MWIFQALHLPPQKHSQTDNVLKFTEIPLRQLDAVLIHRCSDAIIPLLPLKRLSDYTGGLQTEIKDFFQFLVMDKIWITCGSRLVGNLPLVFSQNFAKREIKKTFYKKHIRLHDFSAKHFVVMRHYLEESSNFNLTVALSELQCKKELLHHLLRLGLC